MSCVLTIYSIISKWNPSCLTLICSQCIIHAFICFHVPLDRSKIRTFETKYMKYTWVICYQQWIWGKCFLPSITICSFPHGVYDFVLCLNIKKTGFISEAWGSRFSKVLLTTGYTTWCYNTEAHNIIFIATKTSYAFLYIYIRTCAHMQLFKVSTLVLNWNAVLKQVLNPTYRNGCQRNCT